MLQEDAIARHLVVFCVPCEMLAPPWSGSLLGGVLDETLVLDIEDIVLGSMSTLRRYSRPRRRCAFFFPSFFFFSSRSSKVRQES